MRVIIAALTLMAAIGGATVFGRPSSAQAQTITEYALPADAGKPSGITVGPDGNLWFVTDRMVGRMTPQGEVTTFPVPASVVLPPYSTSFHYAKRIVAGADGNLWFTATTNVVRVTPQGQMTSFALSTSDAQPQGITAGQDGNIWFTVGRPQKIGRITQKGEITEFEVPGGSVRPHGITAAPDGNLWFTSNVCSTCVIGRITQAGAIMTYPITGSTPYEIAANAAGALWFTGNTSNSILRITAAGVMTEFALPTAGAKAHGIASGPDGNMWFTETNGNKIGRITPAGVITEYPLSTGAAPEIIVAGPGGSMWFTESGTSKIGKITVPTGLSIGLVFSSLQTTARSVLRVHNSGKLAGAVSVELADPATGKMLANWASPSIQAGSEREFAIADIESAAVPANFLKPAFYAISVKTEMTGYVRHLLARVSDGTLSSLTACPLGTTTPKKDVAGVHSSLQSKNVSTVIVHNTGLSAKSVTLGIYDARNGTRRGGLPLGTIASNSSTDVTVAAMEDAVGAPLDAGMARYIVKAEGAFSGYLQHLVQTSSGLTADLTPACSLQPEAPPSRADIVEYAIPTPNAGPYAIAPGGDGKMWFTESSVGKVASIADDGVFQEYKVPSEGSFQGLITAYGITQAPNGDLYFGSNGNVSLGKVDRTGSFQMLTDPSRSFVFPTAGVTMGPNGSVWLLEPSIDFLGKWDGTRYTRYRLPNVQPGQSPSGLQNIVAGPDGNMWFTETSNLIGKIGKITPQGVITEFPIPNVTATGVPTNFGSYGIAVGADGNLWVTGTDYITRMTTAGVRTDFLIPSPRPYARGIVLARDGNMWFTENATARIGRITPQGEITEFPMADSAARPDGIAAGPDGDLWMTVGGTNTIARMMLPLAGVHLNGLYSTSQNERQSFVRVYNAGGDAGTITIRLADAKTGAGRGTWKSPVIPANSTRQFSIAEMETAVGIGIIAARPDQYTVTVTADTTTTPNATGTVANTTTFKGYLQHVLWRPAAGILSNVTTCDAGVDVAASQAFAVHSSLFQRNYPAVVSFMNVGIEAAALTLGIYDGADGSRLGVYQGDTIAPRATTLLPVSVIENAIGINKPGTLYYGMKIEGSLLAHAQVVVVNLQAGVSVDMTTACAVN